MDITLSEGTVSGSVTAPASKSYAQRAIAAALLCEGESVLSNMVQCNDTRAALQVAADLGAKISAHEDTYTLHGGLHPRKRQLNIGESGLATRLFTPITALCTETITLTGKGSILKRPISMMEEPLRQLGATVSSQGGYLPIHIRGAIRGGNITVDGSLSSQFITGLLMALPLAAQDTTLTVNDLKSRPYIDMTIGLLKNFGIDIKHNDYRQFFIEGGQRYVPTRYRIEGDWSGASCLLVAGATAGRITVENLNPLSLQADTAIIDALTRAGPKSRRRPIRSPSAVTNCTRSNSTRRTAPTFSRRSPRSPPTATALRSSEAHTGSSTRRATAPKPSPTFSAAWELRWTSRRRTRCGSSAERFTALRSAATTTTGSPWRRR